MVMYLDSHQLQPPIESYSRSRLQTLHKHLCKIKEVPIGYSLEIICFEVIYYIKEESR